MIISLAKTDVSVSVWTVRPQITSFKPLRPSITGIPAFVLTLAFDYNPEDMSFAAEPSFLDSVPDIPDLDLGLYDC